MTNTPPPASLTPIVPAYPTIHPTPLPAYMEPASPKGHPIAGAIGYLMKETGTLIIQGLRGAAAPPSPKEPLEVETTITTIPRLKEAIHHLESFEDFPNPALITRAKHEYRRLCRYAQTYQAKVHDKFRLFWQFKTKDISHDINDLTREINRLAAILDILKGIGFLARSAPHTLRHHLLAVAVISDEQFLTERDLRSALSRGRLLTFDRCHLLGLPLNGDLQGATFRSSVLDDVTVTPADVDTGQEHVLTLDEYETWQTEISQLRWPVEKDDHWTHGEALLRKGTRLYGALATGNTLERANRLSFTASRITNLSVTLPREYTLSDWEITGGNTIRGFTLLEGATRRFRVADAIEDFTARNTTLEQWEFGRTTVEVDWQLVTLTKLRCDETTITGRFHNVILDGAGTLTLEGITISGTLTITGRWHRLLIRHPVFEEGSQIRGTADGIDLVDDCDPKHIAFRILDLMVPEGTLSAGIPHREELIAAGRLTITDGTATLPSGSSPPEVTPQTGKVVEVSAVPVLATPGSPKAGLLQTARANFHEVKTVLQEWRDELLDRQDAPEALAVFLYELGVLPVLLSDVQHLLEDMGTYTPDNPDCGRLIRQSIPGTATPEEATRQAIESLHRHRYTVEHPDQLHRQVTTCFEEVCAHNETMLEASATWKRIGGTAPSFADLLDLLKSRFPQHLPVSHEWLLKQLPDPDRPDIDLTALPAFARDRWERDPRGLAQVIPYPEGYFIARLVNEFPRGQVYGEITGANLEEHASLMIAEAGDRVYDLYFSQSHLLGLEETNLYRRGDLPWGYLVENITAEDNAYFSVLRFAEKGPQWRTAHKNRLREYFTAYEDGSLDGGLHQELTALLRRYHGNTFPSFEDFCSAWNDNFEKFNAIGHMTAA